MPQQRVSQQAALDAAALGKLKQTFPDAGELKEFLVEFIQSATDLVADIQRFAAKGSPSNLERAAHTLKSTAELVGALGLAQACRTLEAQIRREPDDAPPAEAIDELVRQFKLGKEAALRATK